MAPIKFEENIREKLQERELSPSPATWKKLQTQLEEMNPKKKRPFIWYAVAASLISILIIGGFLLNDGTNVSQEIVETEIIEPDTPVVQDVVAESEIATEEVLENESMNEVIQQEVMEVSDEVDQTKASSSLKTSVAQETKKPNVSNIENTNQSPVLQKEVSSSVTTAVASESMNEKKNEEVASGEIKMQSFTDLKVEEVVAQVQSLQTKNNSVTAAEIDALLIKAQRELENQRLLESSTNKIDATALLQSVESEMERGFRDRVFDMLGDGFNKVRTAVAERNN